MCGQDAMASLAPSFSLTSVVYVEVMAQDAYVWWETSPRRGKAKGIVCIVAPLHTCMSRTVSLKLVSLYMEDVNNYVILLLVMIRSCQYLHNSITTS